MGMIVWVSGDLWDEASGKDDYDDLFKEIRRYPIEQARRIWEAGKRAEVGEPAGLVPQSDEAPTPTTASR